MIRKTWFIWGKDPLGRLETYGNFLTPETAASTAEILGHLGLSDVRVNMRLVDYADASGGNNPQ